MSAWEAGFHLCGSACCHSGRPAAPRARSVVNAPRLLRTQNGALRLPASVARLPSVLLCDSSETRPEQPRGPGCGPTEPLAQKWARGAHVLCRGRPVSQGDPGASLLAPHSRPPHACVPAHAANSARTCRPPGFMSRGGRPGSRGFCAVPPLLPRRARRGGRFQRLAPSRSPLYLHKQQALRFPRLQVSAVA